MERPRYAVITRHIVEAYRSGRAAPLHHEMDMARQAFTDAAYFRQFLSLLTCTIAPPGFNFKPLPFLNVKVDS